MLQICSVNCVYYNLIMSGEYDFSNATSSPYTKNLLSNSTTYDDTNTPMTESERANESIFFTLQDGGGFIKDHFLDCSALNQKNADSLKRAGSSALRNVDFSKRGDINAPNNTKFSKSAGFSDPRNTNFPKALAFSNPNNANSPKSTLLTAPPKKQFFKTRLPLCPKKRKFSKVCQQQCPK